MVTRGHASDVCGGHCGGSGLGVIRCNGNYLYLGQGSRRDDSRELTEMGIFTGNVSEIEKVLQLITWRETLTWRGLGSVH